MGDVQGRTLPDPSISRCRFLHSKLIQLLTNCGRPDDCDQSYCILDRKRASELYIRHTPPNIHIIATPLKNPPSIRRPSAQIPPGNCERKPLAVAGIQELLVETAQLLHGTAGNTNVELRDFCTSHVSRVSDVVRDVEDDVPQGKKAAFGDVVIVWVCWRFYGGVCFCSVHRETGVFEGRVA